MSAHAARVALVELERLLQTDAPALRATLPPGFAEACEAYVGLLIRANARLNLTRIVEPLDVGRLHLLDALSALPLLDALEPRNGLDLGTGGGVPGLLLALARPAVSWTLVDSVRKKADVVRSFAHELGVGNVEVVAERAEVLGREAAHRERYDVVAARACAPLPVLAEYALPLLRVDGTLVAWKGQVSDAELRAGLAAANLLGGGEPEVRPTGMAALGDHRFVMITKEHATPGAYPRRPGEPARRPLG